MTGDGDARRDGGGGFTGGCDTDAAVCSAFAKEGGGAFGGSDASCCAFAGLSICCAEPGGGAFDGGDVRCCAFAGLSICCAKPSGSACGGGAFQVGDREALRAQGASSDLPIAR